MLMSRFALAAIAPFALLAPAAAQPAGRVLVTVWSFGFAPHPIQLAAGKPVTLTFANRSGSHHDFTAERFFRDSKIVSGSAPDGEIELMPYETKSITVIPRAGTYKAHCSHFMHKQLGMSDLILVS
jgi:plastocyanin